MFNISYLRGAPKFDAIPVAKIVNYPLEGRDYRPFAQCSLCRNEDTLFLRMWAFEVSPMPSSELRGVFRLFADQGLALHISARIEKDGDRAVCAVGTARDGEAEQPLEGGVYHPFAGEDLQGVYWGALVCVPISLLEQTGQVRLEAGAEFPGNFYKLCADKRFAHSGCYYPADFTGDPYSSGSMGGFRVVSY